MLTPRNDGYGGNASARGYNMQAGMRSNRQRTPKPMALFIFSSCNLPRSLLLGRQSPDTTAAQEPLHEVALLACSPSPRALRRHCMRFNVLCSEERETHPGARYYASKRVRIEGPHTIYIKKSMSRAASLVDLPTNAYPKVRLSFPRLHSNVLELRATTNLEKTSTNIKLTLTNVGRT